MANTVPIRVDASLISVFGEIGKPLAERIKKDFKLSELTLTYPTLSKVVAEKYKGKKQIKFKVRKISRDKGVLELY